MIKIHYDSLIIHMNHVFSLVLPHFFTDLGLIRISHALGGDGILSGLQLGTVWPHLAINHPSFINYPTMSYIYIYIYIFIYIYIYLFISAYCRPVLMIRSMYGVLLTYIFWAILEVKMSLNIPRIWAWPDPSSKRFRDDRGLNPRRMVVPAITDLDMDSFDERKDSQVVIFLWG